ncbi:MAG: carboxypeptidase-like regulatory domain-containing protein [Bacteroidota bacterium]
MKRSFLALFLLFYVQDAFGQSVRVSGVVSDAETGELLIGVNVFFDETTNGTATDDLGYYTLSNIPLGKSKLVFSYLGFERVVITLKDVPKADTTIHVKLRAESLDLPSITVSGSRKAWKKNLKRFKKVFLGDTKNADKTKIKNPEVLRFSKDGERFSAISVEPLIIVNKALGYEIEYQIEEFYSEEETVKIQGFTRFYPLSGSKKDETKWVSERRRAYNGSFRHFIYTLSSPDSSFYEKSGFQVYYLDKQGLNDPSPVDLSTIKKASDFYKQDPNSNLLVLHKPEKSKILAVLYTRENPERRLSMLYQQMNENNQGSWIEFFGKDASLDARTGLLFPFSQIRLNGYWGITGRIPELLPKNYKPGHS